MTTVEELYDRLGIAQKKMEHAARARALEEEGPPVPGNPLHPGCAEHGHQLKGEWTIQTSPSGKRFGKCGRCGIGYLLPPKKS